MRNLPEVHAFAGILKLNAEERHRQHNDEQQNADDEDRAQCYRGLTGAGLAGRHQLRDTYHFRPNSASQQRHSRSDLPPAFLHWAHRGGPYYTLKANGDHFEQQMHAADTPRAAPVLFPEWLEPEQDRYVHEDKDCNTDISPDAGLEKK